MGFTREELNTLLCYGIKPWDDFFYAWDFLHSLKEAEEESDNELEVTEVRCSISAV